MAETNKQIHDMPSTTAAEANNVSLEHTDNNFSTSSKTTDLDENGSAGSLKTEEALPAARNADATLAEPEASRTTLQTVIIMVSLCASVFLAALDVTIITTALPTISEHFNSSAGYTWIGAAYLLANAASTPSW